MWLSVGFHMAAGGKQKKEKRPYGVIIACCNRPTGHFETDSAAKNICSLLKLQFACGPCSSVTYKESLSHKPTLAEETWQEGGEEEKLTEGANM